MYISIYKTKIHHRALRRGVMIGRCDCSQTSQPGTAWDSLYTIHLVLFIFTENWSLEF